MISYLFLQRASISTPRPTSSSLNPGILIQLGAYIDLNTQVLLLCILLPPNSNECEDTRLLCELSVRAIIVSWHNEAEPQK